MPSPVDLLGRRFDRWVVLERGPHRQRKVTWLCQCDCGNKGFVITHGLLHGHSRSCGCLTIAANKKRATHGESGSRTYKIWAGILQRTTNPNNPGWKNYGGRGIRTCKRWSSFKRFLEDVGEVPLGLTIDRINNNKGYYPGNVRFATYAEQLRNRRVTRWITYKGITLCRTDWAKRIGLHPEALRKRFRLGWPVERALGTKSSAI